MGRGSDFGRIREEPENKLTQRRKGAKVKIEIEIAAKRRKKRKKEGAEIVQGGAGLRVGKAALSR